MISSYRSIRSIEGGAFGEDPAVGSHEPIAARRTVGSHADDRRIELELPVEP